MTTTISKEKLRLLQKYFINRVKNGQTRTFEETVQNIADGSGLALATAHKGIKELVNRGVLTVSKSRSRRFPCVYTYTGELDEVKEFIDKDAQIKYLHEKLELKNLEIAKLKKIIKKMKSS